MMLLKNKTMVDDFSRTGVYAFFNIAISLEKQKVLIVDFNLPYDDGTTNFSVHKVSY